MDQINNFLIGLLLGGAQIGSMTWRTIQTIKGNYIGIVLSSLVISCSYYYSIESIQQHDISMYVGTSIGGLIASLLIAKREKEHDPSIPNR